MSDVQSWIDAGKSNRANGYIHPSGDVSQDAYEASGRDDALVISQKIGDADSVLEFGCGNGRILRNLHHPNVYGVDISPELIAGLDNACLVSEFTGAVDAIYSVSVFIHLKRNEAAEALRWIHEHLNPGGKAYLQIPVYEIGREPDSWLDVGVWSPIEFAICATQNKFSVIEMWGNAGAFDYESIGPHHNALQVLIKSPAP
jgi:SAM-dependent methyltransferase